MTLHVASKRGGLTWSAFGRPREWRARRWLTGGFPIGIAAFIGLGCHSPQHRIVDPISMPAVMQANEPKVLSASALAGAIPVGTPSLASDRPAARLGQVQAIQAVEGPIVSAPKDDDSNESTRTDSLSPTNLIDLGVALRLAGVDNPTINLARERIEEALANQLAADSLLLPTLNAGGNYRQHNGPLLSSAGFVRDVNLRSAYAGWGARTLAAETVAFPGVRLFAHLGDAAYEPLAARQRVTVRRFDAQAVQNAILLDVVTAYIGLAGAEAQLQVLRDGQTLLAEVARIAEIYAQKGQGRQGEAQRAAANVALLNRQLPRAVEEIQVASSQLTRLLSLDPTIRLRTPTGPIEPFQLVPEDTAMETLVAAAIRSRPELFARSAAVDEAQVRVRQERVRPWLPLVSVGYSAGVFGGGSNLTTPDFSPFSGRSDFDVWAIWTFESLGFGNRARTNRADAVVGQTIADLNTVTNQVRREVADALAAARAAARQMETARQAIGPGEEGFKVESERVRQGQGRPIELLDSFRQLLESRRELIRATVAFNIAQFRLYVAIGRDPLGGTGAGGQCEFSSSSTNVSSAGCSTGATGSYPGSPGSGSGGGSSLFGINRE